MGLQIIVPGASFTHYADIVGYPVPDALTSLHYLGGSSGASIENHAPGGVDASVAGSVSYDTLWANISGDTHVNYIQTADHDDSADETLIAVFRMPDAAGTAPAGRAIFSCYNGAQPGASLFHHMLLVADNSSGFSNVFYNGTSSWSASQADFHFHAGVVSGTDCKAYQMAAGIVTQGDIESRVHGTNNNRPYRIGGHYAVDAGYNDRAQIAMVAKHARALTLEELQAVYDYVKSYYGRRGLNVL